MTSLKSCGMYRCTVSVVLLLAVSASAQTLIFEYRSELGTMPHDQGWSVEAQTLREAGPDADDCPRKLPDNPDNDFTPDFQCEWFGGVDATPQPGAQDNDGTKLPLDGSGGGYLDGTRSPTPWTDNPRLNYPTGLFEGYLVNYVWRGETPNEGTETYSEWIEFDDDEDNLHHFATLGQHLPKGLTPKGASNFPGAPSHLTLRLVGGDGNGIANSLPFVASFNNQDGQAMLTRSYESTNITGTVTVEWRGALAMQSEGEANHAFLLVRAYDPGLDRTVYFAFTWFMPRTFSGGVPVCDSDTPTADCGRFGVINLQQGGFQTPLLNGAGAAPDLGRVLPNTFFTFRAICDPSNGGTATITLINHDTLVSQTAVVSNTTFGNDFKWGFKNGIGGNDRRMVKVGLRHEDDTTAWIDHVKLWQGAPEVDVCEAFGSVIFDTTGPSAVADGKIDQQDFSFFVDNCYTGPTPPAGVFDSLTARCQCMDRNGDNAVDHEDFGIFQRCYTGSTGTLDPSCLD